ncbi:MAG: hypothetical protein OCD76_18400 [Reichenbachiella sp.]
MKKSIIILFIACLASIAVKAQTNDIVSLVDSLTIVWDKEAVVLETYEGMKEFCHSQPHRAKTVKLMKTIHHYDSVLFQTVTEKYKASGDEEAKATLKDIKKLEETYTTASFIKFLHHECNTVVMIEKNYGRTKGKEYQKEVKSLEKELVKYVEEVTNQIDIIDEHIHHLKTL